MPPSHFVAPFYCFSNHLLEFHPVFQVVDTFTGTNSRYNGLFSFEVVGGGETLESIRNFTGFFFSCPLLVFSSTLYIYSAFIFINIKTNTSTEKEIVDYNSGSSTIWAPVRDMRDGGMYTSTGILYVFLPLLLSYTFPPSSILVSF